MIEYTLEKMVPVLNWYKANNQASGWNQLTSTLQNLETKNINGPNDLCGVSLWNSIAKDYQKRLGFSTDEFKSVMKKLDVSKITTDESSNSWKPAPAPDFNNGVSKQEYLINKIQKEVSIINGYTDNKVTIKNILDSIDFWSHPENPSKWKTQTGHRTNEQIQNTLNDKALQIALHKQHKHYDEHMSCLADNDFRLLKLRLASLWGKRLDNETDDMLINRHFGTPKTAENVAKLVTPVYKYDINKFNELFPEPKPVKQSNIIFADEEDFI